MRSRAAIGNHPVHPALVTLPIGAFFLALVGDVGTTITGTSFWYSFSFYALGVGILTALLAAIFGLIDYFGVKMSAEGSRLATIHMVLNLLAVVLYIVTFSIRRSGAAFHTSLWVPAMVLQFIALVSLAIAGWIGGEMAYVHKIGVVENADPEASQIGMRRAA